MAIETIKDSLTLNQIIGQKRENFVVEEDCIVPDVKPDILNIISASGIVCIYKKEIMDEKIRLDGCVNTYIMYLADTEENQVRSLNTNIDFTQMIDIQKIKSEMNLDANVALKGIEAHVLNGRKLHVKAILEIDAKVSSNENVEYAKEINNLKDVQCLNKEIQINSLIGTGNTKIYAKDTINIDEADNLVEVMRADVKIINRDIKTSYNKILIKSDLQVKIIYLTEDNRINMKESIIPVVGFIDLPNISEEHTCNVKYEMKNIIIKPNNVEEHSIYVEAEIEVYCEAYENRNLEMIQDLYSPTHELKFSKKNIKVTQNQNTRKQTYNIKEKQVIPEIESRKIYDVEVQPIIEEQTILNDRIIYDGDLKLNFLYAGNVGIETKEISMPFSYTMDFEGINSNNNVDTVIEIEAQNFVVMPDESIEIRVDLGFTAISGKDGNVSIIDEITEAEDRSTCQYSMIIYFVKPGDTLWSIAKKFGSTVEDISRVNGIENSENLQIGKQLYIPRYHE